MIADLLMKHIVPESYADAIMCAKKVYNGSLLAHILDVRRDVGD